MDLNKGMGLKKSVKTGPGAADLDLPDDAVVVKATIYLSALNDDIMKIMRGVEHFFTDGHGDRTFESMWTHFAIQLSFQNGKSMFLERYAAEGVLLHVRDARPNEYAIRSYEDPKITFNQALQFFDAQRSLPYSFVHKNCKHLVYDFVLHVLNKEIGQFGAFCADLERVWNYRTR